MIKTGLTRARVKTYTNHLFKIQKENEERDQVAGQARDTVESDIIQDNIEEDEDPCQGPSCQMSPVQMQPLPGMPTALPSSVNTPMSVAFIILESRLLNL